MHTGVEGLYCPEPGPTSVPADISNIVSEIKPSYAEGQMLIYKCAKSKGHGYVTIKCGEDGWWSPPSRNCQGKAIKLESLPFQTSHNLVFE